MVDVGLSIGMVGSMIFLFGFGLSILLGTPHKGYFLMVLGVFVFFSGLVYSAIPENMKIEFCKLNEGTFVYGSGIESGLKFCKIGEKLYRVDSGDQGLFLSFQRSVCNGG